MTHARLALGALGAAALLAAGCGSSSDDVAKPAAKPSTQAAKQAPAPSAPVGHAPSKAAYVHRADALCRDASAIGQRANAAVQKALAAGSSEDAAGAIDQFIPAYEAKVEKLKTLPQPVGEEQILGAFMKVMDGQVATIKAEAHAFHANDSAMLQRAQAARAQTLDFAGTLAKGFGFRVCGLTG
ncbi:MAG TPA: hypothetical protein VFT50_15630 [Baekduia sp.]|nr:hypothetical protein [Baekduia sp.]